MKILIFGNKGMLGSVLELMAKRDYEVFGASHEQCDISRLEEVVAYISTLKPDIIINAAGAIPGAKRTDYEVVQSNAVGPLVIARTAERYNAKLLHISTDCVFSGIRSGRHRVSEVPDPIDLYGVTKRVGEFVGPNATVVRTSFIGPQHGLLHWLLNQPQAATIDGWDMAEWSGSTVYSVASSLLTLLDDLPGGIHHLATRRITTKLEVVKLLASRLRPDLKVQSVRKIIHRSLEPTIVLPPFESSISELVRYVNG